MSQPEPQPAPTTMQALFKRYRRPGDIVFAWLVLAISLFLLSQIFGQTADRPGARLFAHPRFWPAVSLIGMSTFAALHLIGSMLSERLEGRWSEVWLWVSSLEYAGWFIAYGALVPWAGYLPATALFAVLLAVRAGYRSRRTLLAALSGAVVTVLLFKTFLQVKLPSGRIYEVLPDGLRQIMLNHF